MENKKQYLEEEKTDLSEALDRQRHIFESKVFLKTSYSTSKFVYCNIQSCTTKYNICQLSTGLLYRKKIVASDKLLILILLLSFQEREVDLLAKEFELAKERQAEFLGDRY